MTKRLLCLLISLFVSVSIVSAQSRTWSGANINNVRYANAFPGATADAKIAAAIADLPSTGGTVDARGLEGNQTISGNVFAGVASTKPIHLILGTGVYSVSATQIETSPGTIVEGISTGDGVTNTVGTVLKWTGASGGTMIQAQSINGVQFKNLLVDPNSLLGVAFQLGSTTGTNQSNVYMENVHIATAGVSASSTVAATGIHPCMVELYGSNGSVQDSLFINDNLTGATCAADSGVGDNTWIRDQFESDSGAYGYVLGSPTDSNLMISPLFTNATGTAVHIAVSATALVGTLTVIKPWFEGGATTQIFKRVTSTSPTIQMTGLDIESPKLATGNGSGNFADLTGFNYIKFSLRDFETISGNDVNIATVTGTTTVIGEQTGGPGVTTSGAGNVAYLNSGNVNIIGSGNTAATIQSTSAGMNPALQLKSGLVTWYLTNASSIAGGPFHLSNNTSTSLWSLTTGGTQYGPCNTASSSAGTTAFDLSLGNFQCSTLTENTAVTISNPQIFSFYVISFTQGATPYTVSWPSNVKGGGAVGSVANSHSLQLFWSDGTNLYAIGSMQTNSVSGSNAIQWANNFTGATAGDKISAAIAALGSTGGVVDTSGMAGGTIATDIFTGVTAPVTIRFSTPGTFTLSAAAYSVPANVTFQPERGVVFAVPAATTVTVNSRIIAGNYKIFSVISTGFVVLKSDKYNVTWFGAVGDDSTDDAPSINTTLTMVGNVHGGVVYAPNCPSAYKLGSSLSFPYTGGSGGSSGSILFQVACNLDLYAAQTWGSSGGGVTVEGLATASANGVSSLGQTGNYANLIHDFTGGPMITLNAGPIELKNLTMKNCVSGCITIAATTGSDFILRNITAYEYPSDTASPLTVNNSIQFKVIDSFFEAPTSASYPSVEIKNTAGQTIIGDFVRDHFFYGGIQMDANFASTFSQFRFDSPLFEDLQLPAFVMNATAATISNVEINNPSNADCVSHGCSLLKTSHGGSNKVNVVQVFDTVGSTPIIDSASDMAILGLTVLGQSPANASYQTQPFNFVTEDSSSYLQAVLLYGPTLQSYTFASLPTEANGKFIYCSDCKNVADDSVAFDSAAAGAGHGTMLLGENGAWRVH